MVYGVTFVLTALCRHLCGLGLFKCDSFAKKDSPFDISRNGLLSVGRSSADGQKARIDASPMVTQSVPNTDSVRERARTRHDTLENQTFELKQATPMGGTVYLLNERDIGAAFAFVEEVKLMLFEDEFPWLSSV